MWKPISPEEVRRWRANLPKGHVRETNVGRTVGLETVEEEDGTVTLDRPVSAGVREPRETVEAVAKQLLDWAQGSREEFTHRIRLLRNAHPEALGHLSDEEAGQQLWDVLQKIAQAAAQERYRSQGWDKGTVIYGDTERSG